MSDLYYGLLPCLAVTTIMGGFISLWTFLEIVTGTDIDDLTFLQGIKKWLDE